MWLKVLVFISDLAITWLAVLESRASNALKWSAIVWDGLLALAIGVNMIGFVEQSVEMLPISILGSMTGMTLAIWYGRKTKSADKL